MAKKASKKRVTRKKRTGRPPLTEEQKAAKREKARVERAERRAALRELGQKARLNAQQRKAELAVIAEQDPLEKKNPGSPEFRPTEDQCAQVEMMAGLGIRIDEIATLVTNPHTGQAIDTKTLKLHFERELSRGPARAHAAVAKSIYEKAIGNGPSAITAAIWFSKTQMGWQESTVVEVEVKSGVLVPPPKVSPQEWIEAANARTIDAEQNNEE